PLFLIWYASIDRNDSAKIKSNASGKSISGDLIANMSQEILSLQSVSKEIASVKSQMRYQWAIFATALLLFLGVLGATANFVFQRGLLSVIESKSTQAGSTLTPTTPSSPPAETTK